jgi:hypothetical protein
VVTSGLSQLEAGCHNQLLDLVLGGGEPLPAMGAANVRPKKKKEKEI